jgi:DNA-binding NtrC family response regulator
MTASAFILVVDDEPDIREIVRDILVDEGYDVVVAEDGDSARQQRRQRRPDLVLLDIWMPDVDGITLLKEWRSEEGRDAPPVVMMSGHGTVETAVEATRLGAYDFLEKPLSMAKLLLTVEHALEADKLAQENINLRQKGAPVSEPIGKSQVMQQLREQIQRIAQHDTPVLIRGESGSGKQVAARYLHACSARRDGPFVPVGVASIASKNAEVELFGEEQGQRIHYGRLEQANGGILYLHDIADMDQDTQGKLVSALESSSFLRVGGNEPVTVNVRLVAASVTELEERVREGRFREDLYYRLNVVPLSIPPLREHSEDIPELLGFYVDNLIKQEGLGYRAFTVASQNRLRHYAWPGNIRELKNLVQRLLIVGKGEQIELQEVEAALGEGMAESREDLPPTLLELPLKQAREQFEKNYLEHLLADVAGNVGELARRAGVERTHMYRKLKSLGIEVKKGKEDR